MIIVSGGAGFIGSALVWQLNRMGREDVLIVDHLGSGEKWKNLRALKFIDYLEKDRFLEEIVVHEGWDDIDAILHMGACSSTTQTDASYLIQNNFEYTKELSLYCAERDIRFIYASSAATYGLGEQGYQDDEDSIHLLRPLNMYGYSKQIFDQWALREGLLEKQVGLKFFNVYGPNEAHKGDMRSVVHKSWGQIMDKGTVSLFKSLRPEYKDGEQMRDFIYIKDAVKMALHFLEYEELSGLYNIGTGRARSWNDLVKAVFFSLEKPADIQYIDMPEHLQSKYQYFTEADISKLRDAGYTEEITSLEDGIRDYIQNYALPHRYLGDEQL